MLAPGSFSSGCRFLVTFGPAIGSAIGVLPATSCRVAVPFLRVASCQWSGRVRPSRLLIFVSVVGVLAVSGRKILSTPGVIPLFVSELDWATVYVSLATGLVPRIRAVCFRRSAMARAMRGRLSTIAIICFVGVPQPTVVGVSWAVSLGAGCVIIVGRHGVSVE